MLPEIDESFLHGDIFKILVGPKVIDSKGVKIQGPRRFMIHKSVLEKHSPYFRALKNFKEGQENIVEFNDLCPAAFGLLAYWFYYGQLPQSRVFKSPDTLMKSYVVGDRLMIPPYKDLVVTALQKLHSEGARTSIVDLVKLRNLGLGLESHIVRYFIELIAYRETAKEGPKGRGTLSVAEREFFERGGRMVGVLVDRILRHSKGSSGVGDPTKMVGSQFDTYIRDD